MKYILLNNLASKHRYVNEIWSLYVILQKKKNLIFLQKLQLKNEFWAFLSLQRIKHNLY